ncbi:hypothetical protein [Halorubrum trueperi]|uniref:Uncharacterized protein n=1 Tax=Halorubrum trueperi TaxID=2004704 RepID=A0ABD5ULC6_9EURY
MDLDPIRRYLEENPTAYAGLRALDVSSKGREQTVAEKDEVPFIFSIAFVPLIVAYTVLKRTAYGLNRVLSRTDSPPISPPDHVFVTTSTHEYRTYTFEEVGKRLLDKNKDVMFLCSPSAADQMDDWQQNGFQTESFRNLLRFVSVSELFVNLVRSVITMYKLRHITSGEFQKSSQIYAFNSTFLEYIKYSSLEPLVRDVPVVHTYSLMPYQVRATVPERLYVYQHGAQRSPGEDAWAAISFFPATLLVWGEAWVENFEPLLHPDTEVCVTGSPWHDYLSESRDSTPPDWDILFIGGSQATTHSEKWEELYEELVADLVQACEDNGWSLAIKLHPIENSDWYREHGWESYVVEFDSIRDAIKSADIAVTHFSSAFVESIALGTPIILNEVWSFGLSELRPISGANFVDSDELEQEIKRVRELGLDSDNILENSRLLNVGESVDRILNIVVDDY